MPAALERALKRKVAGKKWSEERKDAYVYGTLRKTGWKPSTQKKNKEMSIINDRVIHLAAINEHLDSIIEFARGDVLLRKTAQWGAAQSPEVAELTKAGLQFPTVKPVIRKDIPGFIKASNKMIGVKAGDPFAMDRPQAERLMKIIRAKTAQSTRADRASGILKRKGMTLEDLLVARGANRLSDNSTSIEFQYDDDEEKRHPLLKTAAAGGVTGVGIAGALYGIGARAQGLTPGQTARKFGQNIQSIGKGGASDIGAAIGKGYQAVIPRIGRGYQTVAPKVTGAIKTGYRKAAPEGIISEYERAMAGLRQTGSQISGVARRTGAAIGKGYQATKGAIGNILKRFRLSSKIERLIELNERLDGVIQFAGNPEDPGAGQFGGTDPGILGQTYEDAEKVSALQKLKLKIARLRGMGLYNYSDRNRLIEFAGFPYTKAALGAGALGLAGAGTVAAVKGVKRHRKQWDDWRSNAGEDDFRAIARDLYVDKHGAMYPGGHPRLRSGNISQ